MFDIGLYVIGMFYHPLEGGRRPKQGGLSLHHGSARSSLCAPPFSERDWGRHVDVVAFLAFAVQIPIAHPAQALLGFSAALAA